MADAQVCRPTEDLGDAFARLQQSLRGYLRRRLQDPAQVEDLLQDIFVKALTSERAGRRINNLAGWLHAAARTTLIDHYRATGRAIEALDDSIPNPEMDDLRLHQALSACLMPFIDQLAPIYRDTLVATDIQGKTMQSLAEMQRVSLSAIKSRAVRARAMLKETLLACCHVEVVDGFVSDYHRVSPPGCGGKCS
ncbi:MAG: sigma-70 family RNA polymerase sigma factor [Burkholderiales bacterium]